MVYALHKWLISIFSKATKSSNPRVYIKVAPKDPYTIDENVITSYFRSAADRVNATTAAANFNDTKLFFFPEYLENY